VRCVGRYQAWPERVGAAERQSPADFTPLESPNRTNALGCCVAEPQVVGVQVSAEVKIEDTGIVGPRLSTSAR